VQSNDGKNLENFCNFVFLELLVKGQRRLRKLGKWGSKFHDARRYVGAFLVGNMLGGKEYGLKGLFVSLAGSSPRESLG
jgi:hypothetical protein